MEDGVNLPEKQIGALHTTARAARAHARDHCRQNGMTYAYAYLTHMSTIRTKIHALTAPLLKIHAREEVRQLNVAGRHMAALKHSCA